MAEEDEEDAAFFENIQRKSLEDAAGGASTTRHGGASSDGAVVDAAAGNSNGNGNDSNDNDGTIITVDTAALFGNTGMGAQLVKMQEKRDREAKATATANASAINQFLAKANESTGAHYFGAGPTSNGVHGVNNDDDNIYDRDTGGSDGGSETRTGACAANDGAGGAGHSSDGSANGFDFVRGLYRVPCAVCLWSCGCVSASLPASMFRLCPYARLCP